MTVTHDKRPLGHLYIQVLTAPTTLIALGAILARASLKLWLISERKQSINILTGNKHHIATAATIAAVWAALINILFVPEANGTITAFAGFDKHLRYIYKHTPSIANAPLTEQERTMQDRV